MFNRISTKHPFIVALVACVLGMGTAAIAAETVYYYTAGSQPSAAEKAEIAKLNTAAAAPFVVRVRNSAKARSAPTADYVAGAIPAVCRDGGVDVGTPLYAIFDPNNPPASPNLQTTQATVYNGQVVALPGGGSLTLTVTGNAITAAVYVPPDGGT